VVRQAHHEVLTVALILSVSKDEGMPPTKVDIHIRRDRKLSVARADIAAYASPAAGGSDKGTECDWGWLW